MDVVACLLSYVGVRLPPLFSGVGSFGVESTIVLSAGNCSILSASSCECDNVGSAFCRKNDVSFSIFVQQLQSSVSFLQLVSVFVLHLLADASLFICL